MLNQHRAKFVDYVPTKLDDVAMDKLDTMQPGDWVVAVGTEGSDLIYSIPNSLDPAADAAKIKMARQVWSKPQAGSTQVTHQVVSMCGVLDLVTDIFIAADAAGMQVGTPLTLKVDSDGRIKLGTLVNATDTVVATVVVPPDSNNGELIFRGVFQ